MRTCYELEPCGTINRKSFYNKARVEVEDDGTEVLFSYNTLILKRLPNGEMYRVKTTWSESDGWSATTGNHVYAFCYQQCGKEVRKKEFLKIPYEE